MNMPEVRCFLSLDDGRVLKVPPGDPRLAEVRGEPQRYAPVEAIPSRIQYQWLDDFIRSVETPDVRARMEAAINGKGAFRRFKDILLTLPEERRRWFEYRDIKMRERIVEWVAEHGVRATNEAPWQAEDKAALSAKTDTSGSTGQLNGASPDSANAAAARSNGTTLRGTESPPSRAPEGTSPRASDVTTLRAPDGASARGPEGTADSKSDRSPDGTSNRDAEALRDFLIAWSAKQSAALPQATLEGLAQKIAETFVVRARPAH
jgi:hypothetical protein